jgi:hypothetical protein
VRRFHFFLAATGSYTRAARKGERSCVAGGATAGERPPSIMERHAAKKAIFDFVERVTKQDSPDYVPPAERLATFDNDGTLWAEQPM